LTSEGYIGRDAHRTARVNAAGHEGQVPFSQGTWDLLAEALPPGVSLQDQDLGSHRFKELLHPEHLFQLRVCFPRMKPWLS
jgi:class 3 adenylate cyclase